LGRICLAAVPSSSPPCLSRLVYRTNSLALSCPHGLHFHLSLSRVSCWCLLSSPMPSRTCWRLLCTIAYAAAYVAPARRSDVPSTPVRATCATRRLVMQQNQQREQSSSRFRNPFGPNEVPEDQQPVVEMRNLRREPFYDWADDDEKYKQKLTDLYVYTSLLLSLPIAYTTFNVLPDEIPQIILSANIGTFATMLPFVVRLRVGWGFVSERLREKETYFEAKQRALFATKDRETIARDRLIYKTQVKPILRRIDASIVAVAAALILSVGAGEVVTLLEGEAGPSTLKTFYGQEARDITNRRGTAETFR